MADPTPVPVTIAGEHGGALLARKDLLLTLESPKPYPPGQPLSLVLQLGTGGLSLEGRSIGSKKRPDGRYELRLRLINLRREAREALEALLPAS